MARKSLKNIMRLIDVAKEELPVEKSFLDDLKRSIELTDEKNKRLPSQTYKPSGMHCIRQSYYQIIGKEPETNSNYIGIGICNSGSDIHERIQQSILDMRSNGMDCEYLNVADYVRSRNFEDLEIVKEPNFENSDYETKLYNKKLNISFLCDGIIRYKNRYYITEFKTENNNKFWQRQGVDESHYNQATAYSLMFDINEVIFIYICRDNLEMKSYLFRPTSDMKNALIGYIDTCNNYIAKQEVPPKPDTKKYCNYCNYQKYCRKDG